MLLQTFGLALKAYLLTWSGVFSPHSRAGVAMGPQGEANASALSP